MNSVKKTTRILSFRATPPRPGTTIPGNLLINEKWFSRREFRNLCLSAGLTGEEPPHAFIGSTITYEELTVTQEMIDTAVLAGLEGYQHIVQGRTITYKKAGISNININIDWSTVNVTEATLNLAKLTTMFTRRTNAPTIRQPLSTVPAIEETFPPSEETLELVEMPSILAGVKTINGTHTNANGSELSAEQKEAMNQWVSSHKKEAIGEPLA